MAGLRRPSVILMILLLTGVPVLLINNLKEVYYERVWGNVGQETSLRNPSPVDGMSRAVSVRIEPYKGWKSPPKLGVDPKKAIRRRGAMVDEPIHTARDPDALELRRSHFIYSRNTWDGSPIVVPEFKLLFFTIPKIGCTVFKQLFRRMEGHRNWRQTKINGLPHDPAKNRLRYLSHFTPDAAWHMLTSTEWTRAIFLRDPKERILSAYLDKGVNDPIYVKQHCCLTYQCHEIASQSFYGFLQVAHACPDPHWNPFSQRMEGRYWPYLDFIGHMDDVQKDTKSLLESLGAWDRYGASGWGADGSEAIFESGGTVKHQTNAGDRLREFYTKKTEAMVEDMFAEDYSNPLFGFNISASRMFMRR